MKAEFHFEGEPVAFAVVESPDVRALLDGRARIANGWCQHGLSIVRPDCIGGVAYCAVGAIAGSGVYKYLREALPAEWMLISYYNDSPGRIARYNDAPERTQADILALYDRAIALARAA